MTPPALTGTTNHGYIIFDPESPRFTAKCHDPDCTGCVTLSTDRLQEFVSTLPRRDTAEAARKKYWSCVEAENDIFEFPPAPMGVLPGSLVLETPLYRTPTSEDIEDVVDAWNFSPGDLSPVVTKEVLDTVWVLHGFQSSPTELFNLLDQAFGRRGRE